MSASADVLAMAKVEVDLSAIPEGKNVGCYRAMVKGWPSGMNADLVFLDTGHYQMARQAGLHPPSHGR